MQLCQALDDPETSGFSSVQSCSQLELLHLPYLKKLNVVTPALCKIMSVRPGPDVCIRIDLDNTGERWRKENKKLIFPFFFFFDSSVKSDYFNHYLA